MRVTGRCNVCGGAAEDTFHTLYNCPHSRRLWEEMRTIWCLPSAADLQRPSDHWFQSVISHIPDHMIDATLLVTWRAWFERNEVTHDKPLPSTDCSKRFLLSYWKSFQNSKDMPTELVIKGKKPLLESMEQVTPCKVKKGPDKPDRKSVV